MATVKARLAAIEKAALPKPSRRAPRVTTLARDDLNDGGWTMNGQPVTKAEALTAWRKPGGDIIIILRDAGDDEFTGGIAIERSYAR